MAITTETQVIDEKTTPVYSFNLTEKSATGTVTAITLAQTATLTLTLYADASSDSSESIINSRSAQDVMNANNVTLSSSGAVAWVLQPSDTAIQDTTKTKEKRVALFQWSYDKSDGAGTRYGKHEYLFTVRNLKKVT